MIVDIEKAHRHAKLCFASLAEQDDGAWVPRLRSPQRKDGARSGNFTAGVGRQYLGEIEKTDNGNVIVTTHLYDGKKSLPSDIKLYQYRNSLAEGNKDPSFKSR